MAKGEISIQTIFFIFMVIIFVAIIGFGISKIFFVTKTLSDVEKQEILSDISNALEHCEDPLAKGDKKIINIKNKGFNSICLFASGDDSSKFTQIFLDNNIVIPTDLESTFFSIADTVFESGENVMLFDISFYEDNGQYVLSEFDILDSFNVDYYGSTFCDFDLQNTGSLSFELVCE